MSKELLNACINGNLSEVKKILTDPSHQTNIHHQDNYQWKALFYDTRNGHLEIVKYLLTSNELSEHADINHEDDEGWNVLLCSVFYNQLEVLKYFFTPEIKDNINIYHTNWQGENILIIAVNQNFSDIIHFLLIENNFQADEKTMQYFFNNREKEVLDMIQKREMYQTINQNLPSTHRSKLRQKI